MIAFDLTGKVAVVTGAGGGIGGDITKKLAEVGAAVAASDINKENVDQVVVEINKSGGKAKSYQLDISDEAAVYAHFDTVANDFGTIDILVAAAGVSGEGPNFYETPTEVARKIYDVNLFGTGFCIKAALKYMIPKKSGKIVTISSIAGRIGMPSVANYSISKAAIIAMTQSVARAHAKDNININAICPGYLYTPMWQKGVEKFSKILGKTPEETWKMLALDNIAMGRAQEVEDISYATLFLVSDFSKNITGQALNVCGGSRFN
ncbi:MAG TPA: SDR family oxidoreductase [Syntrophomonadaceae bacterium]|nr:SDR family oxidoreductase [Syntrophomonadaceae bacterium]